MLWTHIRRSITVRRALTETVLPCRNHEVNDMRSIHLAGDQDGIHSTMSRISKELEEVESNPSDIVLTAQSVAPFFETNYENSSSLR